MIFKDRRDAGHQLALLLQAYTQRPATLVLALPRGGVPVAFEVAQTLKLPLDVFLVRKLGVPGFEELAMGAIASGGSRLLNFELIDQLQISEAAIEAVTLAEQQELTRREQAFRKGLPPLQVAGKTLLLIDDGLATGASMRVAVEALEKLGPAALVIAAPVAAAEACADFRHDGYEIVCVATPEPFQAVGKWYSDFSQTSDQEVRSLLQQAQS